MVRSCLLAAGVVFGMASVSFGQASPEAAFKGFQEAVKARDGEKAWNLLAKDSQKMMEDGLAPMKAAFAQMEKAPPEAQKAFAAQIDKMLGMSVDDAKKLDGKGFFVAIIKNSDKTKGHGPDEWAEATLIDLKIEGDKAGGNVKTAKKTEPIEFAKEGGEWKIQLPNKNAKKPGTAEKKPA